MRSRARPDRPFPKSVWDSFISDEYSAMLKAGDIFVVWEYSERFVQGQVSMIIINNTV